MIKLNTIFKYTEIENLGYYTGYSFRPVPDILDLKWKTILSPPPANTSKQTISELEFVSQATLKRNEKDLKLIHIVDQNPDKPFIELADEYNVEYPVGDINEFYRVVKPILLNLKGLWNRPRPYQLAKYYNTPIDFIETDTTNTASYPSGHTVYASLVSYVLYHHYPIIDRRKLDILVANTAKARVLQGAHFPSDNKASLELTKILFNQLKEKVL